MPTAARRPARRPFLSLIVLALFALTCRPAHAGDRFLFSVYGGLYDVEEVALDTPEAGFEVRLASTDFGFLPSWLALQPIAGATQAGEGNVWVYAGLRYDWQSAESPAEGGVGMRAGGRFGIALSFAVSYYEPGDGKDLGGPLEFRSYGEINVRVGKEARLGFGLYHLSNGGIYDPNPGSESVVVSLSFPLGGS